MEFSDPKGIYLQIADRMRERILRGEWKTGERIPSIRELAIELGVNPNTVTKSYQKLLDRELISNQRGRGYFVSENAAERALQEMREEFMRDELPRIVGAMRLLGIGMEEIAGPLSRSGNPEPEGDDTS
ncbi:MAG: GntR family transcriptional regulator [Chromatiales bacterium]|nr:GntR family transcriptional regulator [Chromatiales bacterium]